MYRDGLGVERNLKTALMHFHAAAQQDLADAQVNLGKYHFGTLKNQEFPSLLSRASSADTKESCILRR